MRAKQKTAPVAQLAAERGGGAYNPPHGSGETSQNGKSGTAKAWRLAFAVIALLSLVPIWAVLVSGAVEGASSAKARALKAETALVTLAKVDSDAERIQKAGLSRNFTVRDFAIVDGDGVAVGNKVVLLTEKEKPISAAPGPLLLRAKKGNIGCATVEIRDGAERYQLCLDENEPIQTFVK